MPITKTVRITGESSLSIEAAIKAVLEKVDSTLRGVQTYEVVRVAGRLDDSNRWMHEVTCDVTFAVNEPAIKG